jgi:hypothetical protein
MFKKDLGIDITVEDLTQNVLDKIVDDNPFSLEERDSFIRDVLSKVLKEDFEKEKDTSIFRGTTKSLLARSSQYYDRPWANYWFGLTPKDIKACELHHVPELAFICDNKGVVLIPVSQVTELINQGSLWKSLREGELRHYHIHFQEKDGTLYWKTKKGAINLAGKYYMI